MKWLGDENLEAEYVRWLRDRGGDVFWACESKPSASDPYWLDHGLKEGRVLVTSDRGFGGLVVRDRLPTVGVVLLRLHQTELSRRLSVLETHWPDVERNCPGHFITVTERKLRVRPIELPSE